MARLMVFLASIPSLPAEANVTHISSVSKLLPLCSSGNVQLDLLSTVDYFLHGAEMLPLQQSGCTGRKWCTPFLLYCCFMRRSAFNYSRGVLC